MEEDEVSIRLPISAWRIVIAHVESGVHRDVSRILTAMYVQINPEIRAQNARAAARQVEAARRADEIAAETATRTAGAPDDTSEIEPSSQSKPLH
jgi:hypothetical protein